jgi:hypothetical protein
MVSNFRTNRNLRAYSNGNRTYYQQDATTFFSCMVEPLPDIRATVFIALSSCNGNGICVLMDGADKLKTGDAFAGW